MFPEICMVIIFTAKTVNRGFRLTYYIYIINGLNLQIYTIRNINGINLQIQTNYMEISFQIWISLHDLTISETKIKIVLLVQINDTKFYFNKYTSHNFVMFQYQLNKISKLNFLKSKLFSNKNHSLEKGKQKFIQIYITLTKKSSWPMG